MKRLYISAIATSALIALPAFSQADCDRPDMINVPAGTTSTLDEMLEAQANVRDFLATMEEYLDCVNAEIESAPKDSPPETQAEMIEQFNSGITEMETVAARFNDARVAYQEANPSE